MSNPQFINGVRVTIEEIDGWSMRKRTLPVIESLSLIARQLGARWSISHRLDCPHIFYLVYNGGHKTENGYTLKCFNNKYMDGDAEDPAAWLFSVSGEYPAPKYNADQIDLSAAPSRNVKLKDTKRSVTAIKTILEGVADYTQRCHANIDRLAREGEIFLARLNFAAGLSGRKVESYDTQAHPGYGTFHTPFNGAHGMAEITVYKSAALYEFKCALTEAEIVAVMAHIAQLRKSTKLQEVEPKN